LFPTFTNSGLFTAFDGNFLRNLRIGATTGQVDTRPQPWQAYSASSMRIDPVLSVLEPHGFNRFLPLPTFQEQSGHFFVWRDQTVMEQGCDVGIQGDNHPSTFAPWIVSPFLHGMGRRAVENGGITLIDGFWQSGSNLLLTNPSTADSFTEGL